MSADVSEAVRLIESVIRNLGLDPSSAVIPGDAATKAFALKRGSARVVVAVHATDAGGTFRVLSPCVRLDAKTSPDLYKHLLELNAREIVGAAFGIFGDEVVVVAERSVKDLDESEVEAAIRTVGRIGDRYDDALSQQFGVKRSSD
ncbi:MAG: YbjN domain-containing protein [Sandaracinaceae bacterium]|jgi:hypothetical protein|nr:YbjN domain-containing protein [Sandaracinaceae bacterium]